MKRPFLFPVSAALLGILLAFGVFALKQAAERALGDAFVVTDRGVMIEGRLDELDRVRVEVDRARLEAETVREVMQQVREELRESLESNRDLTEAERARLKEALQRLNEEFSLEMGLTELEGALSELEPVEEVADVKEPPEGSAGPPIG
ncbi:MAG: hypothetical protein JSU98_02965 [Gemmatimonadales bacterium]|jgi:uncharacterized protein (DUF3084 family)|nr:MAG: hypothetical protein JSU98_02965 [Gemmatimonadales bacterium]